MTEKCCSNKQCQQQNPQSINNFYKRSDTKCGLMSRCKSCLKDIDLKRKDKTSQYKKKWKMNNKDKAKNYYENNKEKILRKSRERNATPEGKIKQKIINLKRYNLTLEQYNKMLINQNHKCAICNIDEVNTKTKRLVVDHNHNTNEIRNLLCSPCNFLIGLAKENPEILRKSAEYLEKFNKHNNVIKLNGVLNAK